MNLDLDETERRARNAQVGSLDPCNPDHMTRVLRYSTATRIVWATAPATILELVRMVRKLQAANGELAERLGHAEEQLRRKEATIAGGHW